MNRPRHEAFLPVLEHAAALLYPRRCPFCGALLGPDAVLAAVCSDCAPAERRLRHTPPCLPETEHSFTALSRAVGAYYYADEVRHAILLCKEHAHPWYARELADLALIHVFGARPAPVPGARPQYIDLTGLPLYHCIVPVPPRQGSSPPAESLPYRVAKRLGAVLGIPVRPVLTVTRATKAQKTLDREERFRNVRGAYAAKPGTDLTGRRVLLVDDIITTGATVSACALALQRAGAEDVTAFCLAADEELPKAQQRHDQTDRRTKDP